LATVIKIEDRVSTPRGRKANLDQKLVKLLTSEKLPLDSAIVLGESEGVTKTDPKTAERASVQNRIRSHWKAAGRTEPVSIRFRPDGFPQVSVNPSKMESK